ncbi:hypothetical protein SDC9_53780 [bioreactor metagenome]|uniref:Uncharacterized protein n=1 Tax=bioreactor metagenome TaxID=1076179 RepID=A0A644WZW1_9ZZZZ
MFSGPVDRHLVRADPDDLPLAVAEGVPASNNDPRAHSLDVHDGHGLPARDHDRPDKHDGRYLLAHVGGDDLVFPGHGHPSLAFTRLGGRHRHLHGGNEGLPRGLDHRAGQGQAAGTGINRRPEVVDHPVQPLGVLPGLALDGRNGDGRFFVQFDILPEHIPGPAAPGQKQQHRNSPQDAVSALSRHEPAGESFIVKFVNHGHHLLLQNGLDDRDALRVLPVHGVHGDGRHAHRHLQVPPVRKSPDERVIGTLEVDLHAASARRGVRRLHHVALHAVLGQLLLHPGVKIDLVLGNAELVLLKLGDGLLVDIDLLHLLLRLLVQLHAPGLELADLGLQALHFVDVEILAVGEAAHEQKKKKKKQSVLLCRVHRIPPPSPGVAAEMDARSLSWHERVKSTMDSWFLTTLVVTGKSTAETTPASSRPFANSTTSFST